MSHSVGGLHDLRVDPAEHQLGASKHLEVGGLEIAPGEIDETLPALSLNGGTAEVEAVVGLDDIDVEHPERLGRVGADQVGRVAPELHTNVHVVHDGPIGTTEAPTG